MMDMKVWEHEKIKKKLLKKTRMQSSESALSNTAVDMQTLHLLEHGFCPR